MANFYRVLAAMDESDQGVCVWRLIVAEIVCVVLWYFVFPDFFMGFHVNEERHQ